MEPFLPVSVVGHSAPYALGGESGPVRCLRGGRGPTWSWTPVGWRRPNGATVPRVWVPAWALGAAGRPVGRRVAPAVPPRRIGREGTADM